MGGGKGAQLSGWLGQGSDYAGGVEEGVDENGSQKRAALFIGVAHTHGQREQGRPVSCIGVHGCEQAGAYCNSQPGASCGGAQPVAKGRYLEEGPDCRLEHAPKEQFFECGHNEDDGDYNQDSQLELRMQQNQLKLLMLFHQELGSG